MNEKSSDHSRRVKIDVLPGLSDRSLSGGRQVQNMVMNVIRIKGRYEIFIIKYTRWRLILLTQAVGGRFSKRQGIIFLPLDDDFRSPAAA